VNQTVTIEDVVVDGKEYIKTTTTTVTLQIKLKQTETFYSYEELLAFICSATNSKNVERTKDTFDRHLRLRMQTIRDNNIVLPAPLYVNTNGLNDFYIVQGDRKKGSLLFKRICYD